MENGKMTEKQRRFADEYIMSKSYGIVYSIYNTVNKKRYIGVTTRSIKERFEEHCKAKSVIGKAIAKYGRDKFIIRQLDEAENKESLFELEKFYIRKYNTFKSGYNATLGGDGVTGDIYIDVVLDDTQKRFVDFVREENKRSIDVSNTAEMICSVLLNMAQIYLICDKKTDKRESAKMFLRIQSPLLERLIDLNLFDLEELRRWAQWRNTKSG